MSNIFDIRGRKKADRNIDMGIVNRNREIITKKDIIALIIAALKIIVPIIIGIVLIYFFIILLLVKVWFK